MITPITSQEHLERELKSKDPVLVFFFMRSSGPCRIIRPVLESELKRYPEFRAFSVDIDEQLEVSYSNYIEAVPTFKIFENGSNTATMVGADPRRLNELIAYRKSSESGRSSYSDYSPD